MENKSKGRELALIYNGTSSSKTFDAVHSRAFPCSKHTKALVILDAKAENRLFYGAKLAS